jgi:hypothetical protein
MVFISCLRLKSNLHKGDSQSILFYYSKMFVMTTFVYSHVIKTLEATCTRQRFRVHSFIWFEKVLYQKDECSTGYE